MKIKLALLGIVLVTSSGCIRQKKVVAEKTLYRLEHLNAYTAPFAEEKSDILLAVKKLSPHECLQLFGVNVIRCGYQPVQITITNFSEDVAYISPTYISLPVTSPKKVAKNCHWKTSELVTGAGALACVFYWPALIPTAYCGMLMQENNSRISKNIVKQDMVQCWDNITVLPSENISRIIFVATHLFSDDFYITIHSAKNKNIQFHINLDNKNA